VHSSRFLFLTGALTVAGLFAQTEQTSGNAPAGSTVVIKTETRLVLVDAVVTDKKGNSVANLAQKDFHVWEDNKEQTVKSFSYEEMAPANSQKRYLILFFDNSTMAPDEQVRARAGAATFITANAGRNLAMAIADFGGTLQITQTFTNDAERLKRGVGGLKQSTVSTAGDGAVEIAAVGMPSLGSVADFGVRSSLLAMRSLARSLASVPSRKTLILFTSGYKIRNEQISEVTAAINECNKANVAVYPIDVRGIVPTRPESGGYQPRGAIMSSPAGFPFAAIIPASLIKAGSVTVWPYAQLAALSGSSSSAQSPAQRGGGGGTGGGGGRGGSGGGTGGGTGGGGRSGTGGGTSGGNSGGGNTGGSTGGGSPFTPIGTVGSYSVLNPLGLGQPRLLIPQLPTSASDNQQVMYMLASGTGGFVTVNTDDLVSGLEKIAKELNQYYLLGYTPAESNEGSCHSIKVKVERGGTIVRARSGYCNIPPRDPLAGKPVEKELEAQAAAAAPGALTGSISDPFFYTSANTARVNLAMELPPGEIRVEKVNGKLHGEVNILAVAYEPDGTAAARFSDTLKLDFNDKKELEGFKEHPFHYENQLDVPSGHYDLKVVFDSGSDFGKVETPLVVDPWDGKHLSLSAVAFSKEFLLMSGESPGLDAQVLVGHTPLIALGVEIVPSGTNHVKKGEDGGVYVEVYEPALLSEHPLKVMVQLKVLDRKTGAVVHDTGMLGLSSSVQPGSPVVPVALKLPLDELSPGSYRASVQAANSAGRKSVVRTMDFDVE
jgi:VWFA-related protein